MTSPSHPNQRQVVAFVRAIAVLALPADAQTEWLGSLADFDLPIDELALEFDDGWVLLNNFLEGDLIPREVVPALTKLDSLLTRMSGPENADKWTAEALSIHPDWDGVRTLAREVLSLIP